MTEAARRVLSRLAAIGFQVHRGEVTPFGERLQLVVGAAWDERTAQLALVAEGSADSSDDDPWRQLLFAVSGLRHHLSEGARPAFGTPVVLALVDEPTERALRDLAERLTEDYVVFSRVDLNLVRLRDVKDPDALDLALAPLLPRCRTAASGKETIARADVQRFWKTVREKVYEAAAGLDATFDEVRSEVAEELADALIGSSGEEPELSALDPVDELEVEHFRSFERAHIDFSPVTVLHGNNGSGKSSVLEGLELLWSGNTQRRPVDVDADEYARHLRRDGDGTFVVRGRVAGETAPREVREVRKRSEAELVRGVLTQDVVGDLVNSRPDERYVALLAVTGLEIPELESRTRQMLDDAKRDADAALDEVQLPPIPGANRDGLRHLHDGLARGLARRLPSIEDLSGAEQALAAAAGRSYRPRDWSDHATAVEALVRVDGLLETVAMESSGSAELDETLDTEAARLREHAAARRRAAGNIRPLLDALNQSDQPEHKPPPLAGPIPPALAARWAAHAEGLLQAATSFRTAADELDDGKWVARLKSYADAVEAAGELAPLDELAALGRTHVAELERPAVAPMPPRLYEAAGFLAPPGQPSKLVPALRELHRQLQAHADSLDSIAAELDRHPARRFARRRSRVLREICRFELARIIRRRGPIARASESMLKDLLQGTLYPIVRELVEGIARFEWYFRRLEMHVEGGRVVIGGLATPSTELDARLLLNSAERTVVGVAWFLALHLLQPEERRRVLVLDDPVGAFDLANQAGFVATLRAFIRLTRPEQFVISTHDDAMATTLEIELGPVAGWPSNASRIRCQRDADDASTVKPEDSEYEPSDFARELLALGLEVKSEHVL